MSNHPFVLTSMGTGTSVFHVAKEAGTATELMARTRTEPGAPANSKAIAESRAGAGPRVGPRVGTRVAGTGVGGGTLTGLGSLLLSTGDFAEIMSMASVGRRQRVDLMVSDLYRGTDGSPVLSALTAANFGRGESEDPEEADVASAIVQLVVEVVAVLSIQVARAYKDPTTVLAGSPIGHPHIRERFLEVGRYLGHQFAFLDNGAFCGALGAILLPD